MLGGPDRMDASLLPAAHARREHLRVRLVIEPTITPGCAVLSPVRIQPNSSQEKYPRRAGVFFLADRSHAGMELFCKRKRR